MEPGRLRPAKKIDLGNFSLLSECNETAPLDRYFKGPGNSLRRVLSFLFDLFPTRRSSAARLEQSRSKRTDNPETSLVQSFGTRFSCRRRLHHPKWLDVDAINDATRRIGASGLGQLVSGAVSAALPDVLGGASGLSRFTFCRPSRTSGQPHHSQPARPALHRYPDELHVPKRGVVVLLHADPVLFNLSPALLGSAPRWTMVVSNNRVCCRIFRALRVPRAVAARRIMGPRRLRDLSITRVRTRDIARDVAPRI